MCGIAGLFHADPQARLGTVVGDLARVLHHRGPDDDGVLAWRPGAGPDRVQIGRDADLADGAHGALYHRRLSIIDLTEAGWQPMGTPDGRLHVVFNGEIYNYVELRSELEADGVRFVSDCDTEVLLHAWDRWGPDALTRFVGMFAFAVLDAARGRLDIARDAFGIKPLFWTGRDVMDAVGGGPEAPAFAFASDIRGLLHMPGVPRTADAQRVWDYLRFGRTDAETRTMFGAVRQLRPGHRMTVDLETFAVEEIEWWRLEPVEAEPQSFADAAAELRERFLESVRLHLRSDVPLGSCLSGGIDSSAIVMAARHVLGPSAELHTFSYLPDDPRLSEAKWVDIVNDAAGAIAHPVRPDRRDLVTDLDSLIDHQGEPFGGLSMYAQHRVFQAAREAGVTVMLDGQGADELLGGYQGMSRLARMVSMLRQRQRIAPVRLLTNLAWRADDVRLIDFMGRALDRAIASDAVRTLPLNGQVPATLDGDWFRDRGVTDTRYPDFVGDHALRSYLIAATTRTSLPHLLRYEDRNSMAYSIESRVPFLTPDLAQFMLSQPESYLVDDQGTAKSLFREAMRGIVPDAILDRKDKIGFTTPIERWMRDLGDWVEETLDSDTARTIGAIDADAMVGAWRETRAGQRPFDRSTWRWVNLIRWADRFAVDLA